MKVINIKAWWCSHNGARYILFYLKLTQYAEILHHKILQVTIKQKNWLQTLMLGD